MQPKIISEIYIEEFVRAAIRTTWISEQPVPDREKSASAWPDACFGVVRSRSWRRDFASHDRTSTSQFLENHIL